MQSGTFCLPNGMTLFSIQEPSSWAISVTLSVRIAQAI